MQKATTAAPVIWIRQSKLFIVHLNSTNLTTASKIKKQVLQARLAFVRCENYWHLRAQTAFMQFRQSIYLLFAASPTDDEEYLYIRRRTIS